MGAERASIECRGCPGPRPRTHETGHAIVAPLLPDTDRVHKVTIVPRGRALGVTQILPDEDALDYTLEQLQNRITFMMGGRAAEVLVFNEFTTGAANDLKQATRIARAMVTEYGMSETVGPMSIEGGNEVFLGRDLGRSRPVSESTAQRVDGEVRRILDEADELARSILRQNIHILERLAQLLLDKETVEGEEFESVVQGLNPVYPVPQPAGA
jgi:ATP-dependent Zn proteases